MLESFRTIQHDGLHEIEIKKSRFIAHLKRTETVEEADAFINAIKDEHSDATHNCSAYLIGDRDQFQKAHDDGEPSGTAGVPMLEILRKRELKNVTAVVTRYFGGIKLGAGGLIRAYSGAVNDAVSALGVVERRLLHQIRLSVDYSLSGTVEHYLKESEYLLRDTEYTEKVTYICYIETQKIDQFKTEITNLTSDQVEFTEGDLAYIEIPQEK